MILRNLFRKDWKHLTGAQISPIGRKILNDPQFLDKVIEAVGNGTKQITHNGNTFNIKPPNHEGSGN